MKLWRSRSLLPEGTSVHSFDFSDRTAIIQWEVQMEDVEFPAPGNYRLQLFAGGEFMLERRLTIHQTED
jgi:hypothetical protein